MLAFSRYFILIILVILCCNCYSSIAAEKIEIDSFKGENIILNCGKTVNGVKRFEWYFGHSFESVSHKGTYFAAFDGIATSNQHYMNRSYTGYTLSPENGQLTISEVEVKHGGWYLCKHGLNRYANYLTVNVQPTQPKISGIQNNTIVSAGESRNISCYVKSVKPAERTAILWMLDDENLSQHQTDIYENTKRYNVSRLESEVEYTFTEEDHCKLLKCIVKLDIDGGETKSETVKFLTRNSTCTEPKSVLLIVAISIGVLLLICLIVVVIWLTVRRSRSTKQSSFSYLEVQTSLPSGTIDKAVRYPGGSNEYTDEVAYAVVPIPGIGDHKTPDILRQVDSGYEDIDKIRNEKKEPFEKRNVTIEREYQPEPSAVHPHDKKHNTMPPTKPPRLFLYEPDSGNSSEVGAPKRI